MQSLLFAEPADAIVRANRGVRDWKEGIGRLAAHLRSALEVGEILPRLELGLLIDPCGSPVLPEVSEVSEVSEENGLQTPRGSAGTGGFPPSGDFKKGEASPRMGAREIYPPPRDPASIRSAHPAWEAGGIGSDSVRPDLPDSLEMARQTPLQPAILLTILQRHGERVTAKAPATTSAATETLSAHPVIPIGSKGERLKHPTALPPSVPAPFAREGWGKGGQSLVGHPPPPPLTQYGKSGPIPAALSALASAVEQSTGALVDRLMTQLSARETDRLFSEDHSAPAKRSFRMPDRTIGGRNSEWGEAGDRPFAEGDRFGLVHRWEADFLAGRVEGRPDVGAGTGTVRLDEMTTATFAPAPVIPALGAEQEAHPTPLVSTLEKIVAHLATIESGFSDAATALSKGADQKDGADETTLRWLADDELSERLNGILLRQAKRRGIDLS